MIKLIVAALAAFMLAGFAPTQTPISYADIYQLDEPGGHVITNPDRISAPSGDALARAYPTAAAVQHVNGVAALNCRVTAEGGLADCEVAWEAPNGLGFGEAALSLTPLFKMRPGMLDGKPMSGFGVLMPITFAAFPDQPRPARPPVERTYAPLGSRLPPPPELSMLALPQGPLGILGVTKQGTLMSFLALDGQNRRDGQVEVTTLNVIPQARSWTTTFQVMRSRIDCPNGTIAELAMRFVDADGQSEGWNSFGYPNVTRPKSSIDQRTVDVACNGPRPNIVVHGSAEALATARGWPGH